MRKLSIFLVCSLGVTLATIFSGIQAATLEVRPDGFGSYPTLQAAIDAAAPGDTVLALPGTFAGPGNRELDFGGKDLALVGRDGAAYTSIDCQHIGRALTLTSGETTAALFRGFRIVNGGNSEINGGGIRCEDSGLTVRDVRIAGAGANSVGGIDIVSGSADIEGVIIESCLIGGPAGGIGLYWATSTSIRNCILANNSSNGYGGGIHVYYSQVSMEGVHFIGNHAGISGGGLMANGSEVSLLNCVFSGNDARDGAAVSMRGSTLAAQECVFVGNYASRWGAALYYDSQGNPSGGLVENCDFRGNNSAYGGIIQLMNDAFPVLRNLTIVGNNHGDGIGAGCCGINAADVENCLIAFNNGGYGISDDPVGGSWLWPVCSNIYGNEFGEYENADQTGVNGNVSVDPQLCDPSYETLGLADSSPCLPQNNACGVLMGNHGAECTLTAVGAPAPRGVTLEANYPNPFNPSTAIPFVLGEPMAITLAVFDVSGRLICTLAAEASYPVGRHELRWDGLDAVGQPAPSGVYFYRLGTPAGATARPMLLVK